MSGEEEKETEKEEEEAKEEVKASETPACPFCTACMVEVSRIGRSAYKELFYEVVLQCKFCGFQATFKKGA